MKNLFPKPNFYYSLLILFLFLSDDCLIRYNHGCTQTVSEELKPASQHTEFVAEVLDESIFPPNYPKFLRNVYTIVRFTEKLKQLDRSRIEAILDDLDQAHSSLYRQMLLDEKLNLNTVISSARAQIGMKEFEIFLNRFGIDPNNQQDINLEVSAQVERMHRREALQEFIQKFNSVAYSDLKRDSLIIHSNQPYELEYALRYCQREDFEKLLDIVIKKDFFKPRTPQDERLLQYLKGRWRKTLKKNDSLSSKKWCAVIAQLVSQRTGLKHGRIPFSKLELYAMLRNTERTVEQRKHAFIDLTHISNMDNRSRTNSEKILNILGKQVNPIGQQKILAYGFLDSEISIEVDMLIKLYDKILNNTCSGQTRKTKSSILTKKEILQSLKNIPDRRLDANLKISHEILIKMIKMILQNRNELYRLPFIRGIIILEGENRQMAYRLLEEFPMIIAGATYPYQWKHDNEVNIALLLANVDPYLAAQAVRFIIYYGMWRGDEAKKLGLYGWLPQIIFGDRQTGKLPEFDNKIYYYFPDFRFRPTKKIDSDNERNCTSEIMQLPFFGWTVWRVYEELREINEKHALAFLAEVYPYVRANTEAIRTALDPFNEGILSGRDAWVNGMDNAWYHQMVMYKHLPERFMPEWAINIVKQNRVDNRIDKKPGNPVDPNLAKGRPSEYYYIFKIIFYDIMQELGLDPLLVYHASPYNSKDVAITAVMARSLESQILMAEVISRGDFDIKEFTQIRNRKDEIAESWDEELASYKEYLAQMKKVMNTHLWSKDDQIYYNCNVTQIFPGIIEQQFCSIKVDDQNRVKYHPREEYWDFVSDDKGGGKYILNDYAYVCLPLDQQRCSISMDVSGKIEYLYHEPPKYWERIESKDSGAYYTLKIDKGDPFIVEQFCQIKKDANDKIRYEPNPVYWIEGQNEDGKYYNLNEKAQRLRGKGTRKLDEGDILRSPAIAGFFPLFGHIPNEEQAFELTKQVVNPWIWWPVDGIPIPTQPMMIKDSSDYYLPNDVYDPDKYWLGPSWMSSTKPVIDGFHSYGYEKIYLYIVQKTVGTLQNGRAVEHWNPETGDVNTTNVNFPWAASCMAGSIWEELTDKEQNEYLQMFHSNH